MRNPLKEHVYTATCPECKRESGVSLEDAGRFWLARQLWRCPHCQAVLRREELQEGKPESEAKS